MDDSFYVTLPSNGSLDVYPDNTVTEFRNKLARPIHLEGEWEVGLMEFTYPRSWWQICTDTSRFSYADTSAWDPDTPIPWVRTNHARLKPIQTVTLDRLVTKQFLVHRHAQDMVEFYDQPFQNDRVIIKAKDGYFIKFEGKICQTLGFPDPTVITRIWKTGLHPWTSENIDHIFVYTDVIAPQRVGNVEVPLLRQIPVSSDSYLRPVNVTFPVISYYKVNKNPIETIDIELRDGTGSKIPFTSGRTIITLHFRRRQEA